MRGESKGIKDLLPALKNKRYFNYGGQGPLPSTSLKAIIRSWETIQDLGPFTNTTWPYIASEITLTKNLLSQACGVPSHRIALTENVTIGCILPLLGLPFEEGERLLISDCEHPGVICACKELAVRNKLIIDILPVKQLRQGVDKSNEVAEEVLYLLEKHLNYKTKLVVLSHLLWNTGQIMPISLVAKTISNYKSKPFLLVDAAQSFGQIPINEAAFNADIYAFTGHKWAFGPEGLGGVAVSERVLIESRPTLIGWKSLINEGSGSHTISLPFFKDSRRFEIATSCVPLLAGLRCSLELLRKEGSEIERLINIQRSSLKLWNGLNSLKDVITILEGSPPAGLISFSLSQDNHPRTIVKALGRKGIWIRNLEDPNCLRACVHITTHEDEIKALIEGIKVISEKSGY